MTCYIWNVRDSLKNPAAMHWSLSNSWLDAQISCRSTKLRDYSGCPAVAITRLQGTLRVARKSLESVTHEDGTSTAMPSKSRPAALCLLARLGGWASMAVSRMVVASMISCQPTFQSGLPAGRMGKKGSSWTLMERRRGRDMPP